MLRRRSFIFPVLALYALVAACASDAGRNEQIGTIVGAGAGVLIGSQIGDGDTRLLAMAIGALAGSQLGGYVGRQLDKKDREKMQATTQNALESAEAGQTANWSNENSGNSGTITPQERFSTAGGSVCREFQQTVTTAGETATAYGTACKQPDGSWKVVSG